MDEIAKTAWHAIQQGATKITIETEDDKKITISVESAQTKWKSFVSFLAYLKDILKMLGG
ncbi:MAG: hypothetical protein HAW59_05320 [Betaproteobacteria bacterium]|nr:hypothetical protein [Betaproteobacteria bacterium]